MRDYVYYFFDFDGTLVDTSEGVIESFAYALGKFGLKIEDTVPIRNYMGPPLSYSFSVYAHLSEEDTRKAIDYYREKYNSKGQNLCFIPDGMEELLAGLKKQGKVLAVATSKLESSAIKMLEKFGLLKYFDTVSGSDPEETVCTKTAVIEQAFIRLGVTDKSKVLMIGDRKYDVAGAKEAGIDCLGFYSGTADEGELESAGAVAVVHSAKEMMELLL